MTTPSEDPMPTRPRFAASYTDAEWRRRQERHLDYRPTITKPDGTVIAADGTVTPPEEG